MQYTKYPPPKQIPCTIKSINVFNFCQFYWKTMNYGKIRDLLETFKSIRRAIMMLGSDEECSINKDIINELSTFNTSSVEYPWKVKTEQQLPTHNKTFSSYIWFLIYRSMLPFIPSLINEISIKTLEIKQVIELLKDIYANVIKSSVSKRYEKYINESNKVYEIQVNKKGLKYTCNQRTKDIRIHSYKNSIQEYKEFKEETIQKYGYFFFDKIDTFCLSDLSSIDTKVLWIILSLNINIIPEHYTSTTDFSKEFPNYKVENCTEEQWNKLKERYLYSLSPSEQSDNIDDIIKQDALLIRIGRNLISNGEYTPYNSKSRLKYITLEMNFQTDNEKADKLLGRLSTEFFDYVLEEIKKIDKKVVLKRMLLVLENTDKIHLLTLYMQLMKNLNLTNLADVVTEINSENKDFLAKVTALLYYFGAEIKLDLDLDLLLYLFKYREISLVNFSKIKESLKKKARELLSEIISYKKYTLIDIIDR
jgi:hypothetical protein